MGDINWKNTFSFSCNHTVYHYGVGFEKWVSKIRYNPLQHGLMANSNHLDFDAFISFIEHCKNIENDQPMMIKFPDGHIITNFTHITWHQIHCLESNDSHPWHADTKYPVHFTNQKNKLNITSLLVCFAYPYSITNHFGDPTKALSQYKENPY